VGPASNRADIAAGCILRGIATVSVCGRRKAIVYQDVQEVRLEEADAPVKGENICFPIDGFHLNKCEFALNGSELSVQDVHIVCSESGFLHVTTLIFCWNFCSGHVLIPDN